MDADAWAKREGAWSHRCRECERLKAERDNKIEALEQTILGYQIAVELLKEERDKAEAERQEALNQRDAEKHAHDAELIRHYEEKYRLMAENERLLAHIRTIATCVNLHDAITEAKVAIDAARKPKSDADILPVYFESRKP